MATRVPYQGRRSRTMARSDPSAWERSARALQTAHCPKGPHAGPCRKAPIRLSQGMSWKGHGASPGNREKRRQERAIRHQGARMGKAPVMGKAPGPKGLNYLKPHNRPKANQGETPAARDRFSREMRIYDVINSEGKKNWDSKSREEQDRLLDLYNI